jgi:ABC-2 type transport system permease protein
VVGLLLLRFSIDWRNVPTLALVVVVTTISCTAFGLLLGSIGLRARDVFFVSNLVYFIMLLFCGVNVPLEQLPGWIATIGRGLPLTHGIGAARRVVHGASLADVGGAVWREALIAASYATAAYLLFRFFEFESRRRASLETM